MATADGPAGSNGQTMLPDGAPRWTGPSWSRMAELDDKDVTRYRRPDEWPAFWVTLAAELVVAVIAFRAVYGWLTSILVFIFGPALGGRIGDYVEPSPVQSGLIAFAVGVVGAYALYGVGQYLQYVEMMTNGAEITPQTFPRLYPVVEDLRQRFKMPRTRVYVTYSAGVNAYSVGLVPPFFVVFYSPVVENLTVEEFTHVLGHEMGHIKLWHTRIAPLLGGGHYPLPPPLGWLDAARSAVTFYYNRRQEMSCDRLGIVGCRTLRASLAATTKLSVGLRAGIPLQLDGLAPQQQEVATGWKLSHFVGLFLQIPLTHPGLVYRLKAMTEWTGLPLAQEQPQLELAVPVPPQFVEPIEAPVDTPLPVGPGVRR